METLTLSQPQQKTMQKAFQIKRASPYRGFVIDPIFNYTDGTSDFMVYHGDDESKTQSFPRVTLSYVKRVLDAEREEKPEQFRVITRVPQPDVFEGSINITKFDSFTSALLFAIRFNGEIVTE